MIKLTVKKGKRLPNLKALIYLIYKTIFRKSITIKFTKESKYVMRPQFEQDDWLKFTGRGNMIFKKGDDGYYKRKSETFIVFRYNKNFNFWEVALDYSRENYEINFPKKKDVNIVAVNQPITVSTKHLKGFFPLFFYFGGTLPAPLDFTCYIK